MPERRRWSRRSSRTSAGRRPGSRRSPSAAARAALTAPGAIRTGTRSALLACDDARIAALNARVPRQGAADQRAVLAGLRRPGAGAGSGRAAVPRRPRARPTRPAPREAAAAGIALGDHAAHLVVHGVLHLLGHDHGDDARGRGDGGAGDESPCQHGRREPIFALGAPLRRSIRTGEMGETRRTAGGGPRASEDGDPDSPARSFFSRLFRRDASDDDVDEPTRAGGAGRGAREMLGSTCATCAACGSTTSACRAPTSSRCPRRRASTRWSRCSRPARCRGCRSIPRRSTSRSGWCT